jgi:hypothetical protein
VDLQRRRRAAGRYTATLLDDADLGAERELTVALTGATPARISEGATPASAPGGERVELTVRTLQAGELKIGAALRLELSAEHISVWPLEARAPEQRDAPDSRGGRSADAQPPM